ncbi:hypothetical protein [Duodenibacillus massiliensis]|uniref:hypothetical protein n=1 Tax=Duodenibacillus massiliensis TaxID=1852381 RepID=UPI003F7FA111
MYCTIDPAFPESTHGFSWGQWAAKRSTSTTRPTKAGFGRKIFCEKPRFTGAMPACDGEHLRCHPARCGLKPPAQAQQLLFAPEKLHQVLPLMYFVLKKYDFLGTVILGC